FRRRNWPDIAHPGRLDKISRIASALPINASLMRAQQTRRRHFNMASIESVSHEKRVFPPPAAFAAQANVTKADFERLNAEAVADYEGFWAKLARETLAWHKPFSKA